MMSSTNGSRENIEAAAELGRYVLGFENTDKTKAMLVGGKGANLGELRRIDGIRVPDGFCVTTRAYRTVIGGISAIDERLDRLSQMKAGDRDEIRTLSAEIRERIEAAVIPADIQAAIDRLLCDLGTQAAYAVRSSATAEDLPTASFAGQQDSYLNVVGNQSILQHVGKCWASLFTERAVIYRIENGFDHRKVAMAVVIQKMVFAQAAGILFTADPVTADRKLLSIDAGFGLGEALVSGLVNADGYKVRGGRIVERKIAIKKLAIHALQDGGTKSRAIESGRQREPVLTDEQILQLEQIGRKIEAHFGCPQDIEWCLADGVLHVVQSRPITTLYPVPAASDGENHVYISVGHQQMMTDPMKPLGISLIQLTAFRPMFEAGGRLFVDVTTSLATPAGAQNLLNAMGGHDPLIRDALVTLLERGDFIRSIPDGENAGKNTGATAPANPPAQAEIDADVIAGLIEAFQASTGESARGIRTQSGSGLFDFILEDLKQLKKVLFDSQSIRAIFAAVDASFWINEKMREWLGEENAADTLSQSVPNNITSEMGLELLDVADAIRPYPQVIERLRQAKDDDFLDELVGLEGGSVARDAIQAYLDKYGVRCVGEIDVTRTRWIEKPSTLVPMILGNIRNLGPGAGKRKFEQGRQEALEKERDLLGRLKLLPQGEQKAQEAERMIRRLRGLAGYREYPKFGKISCYFVYRQALLREASKLADAKVVRDKEDVYYLTFGEFHEAVRSQTVDYRIIDQRKRDYDLYRKLTPPRVITSDGEILTGAYKRENLPAGAIVGLPVSSGVVEGRARVILDVDDADLEEGDILVTSFTDPSWTPWFVSLKGLVTEVGGRMTHGSVIAR